MWDLIESVPDHCLSFYLIMYMFRPSPKTLYLRSVAFFFRPGCGSVHHYHPVGGVTRVSVMPRKVTVKIGDIENRCR